MQKYPSFNTSKPVRNGHNVCIVMANKSITQKITAAQIMFMEKEREISS